MDKVSIITPCYNHGLYLEEAVTSIINQTYTNWECIIVDDGSTDNSEEIATALAAKDNRIKYYKKVNGGLASARNFGIEKSNGNYILPLDADDKIQATYIEKALKVFEDNSVKIVYCEAEYFGAKQGRIANPDYSIRELAEMNMIFCSAVFKRHDFDRSGGYNTNMIYGWEDWNLWVSILKGGGTVIKLPEVLFYYRIKKESMLTTLEGSRKQKMFMQLYLNHPDFFDRFYDEPIDFFDKYRALKAYSKDLEEKLSVLKGLVTLKYSSYRYLVRNVFRRVKR